MVTTPAIIGLGLTEMSLQPGGTAEELAHVAVAHALADAGMSRHDLDGLLVASSQGVRPDRVGVALSRTGGLGHLRLLQHVEIKGASAAAMVQQAVLMIEAGHATTVACVFADAPLRPGGTAGSTYAHSGGVTGLRGLERASGLLGSVPTYALLAARYLHVTGGSPADLGAVACAARAWAEGNPEAVIRTPLTMEEYESARMVATPLRVLDCARPVNGAGAIVVGDARRSDRPVHVRGMGQAHPVRRRRAGGESWFDAHDSGSGRLVREEVDALFRRADRTRTDVDVVELYDPFSVVTLCLLESYGFCAPGSAGPFVREGGIAPGGPLPTNTGGGQLSGYYLQGITPLAEAIVQLRSQGGDRQVDGASTAFVAGIGGRLDHHAFLLLDREAP